MVGCVPEYQGEILLCRAIEPRLGYWTLPAGIIENGESLQAGAGAESLEVALVDEVDIPWGEMAFRSIDFALKRYLEDRRAGREGLLFHDIDHKPKTATS